MKRQLILFVIVSIIFISCGNNVKKEVSSKAGTAVAGKSEKIAFAALIANPDNFVGKNVTIDGKVVHVCTETGKKMFIVGENPDIRLYVAAGENISKFPMELLGSEITVEGMITKVAGTAPVESKEKSMGEMKDGEMKMGKDSCQTETALAAQTSMSDIRMIYKSHMVR